MSVCESVAHPPEDIGEAFPVDLQAHVERADVDLVDVPELAALAVAMMEAYIFDGVPLACPKYPSGRGELALRVDEESDGDGEIDLAYHTADITKHLPNKQL